MHYAPVSIPVYNRLNHLKKCIESLKKNKEAQFTSLYIFSDQHRNEIDIEKVLEVREYIKNIDGFNSVIIIEQDTNKNLKNIFDSIEYPLRHHDSVIYLEEDIEVSQNFLSYMNKALLFYKDNDRVFSATGFSCLRGGSNQEVYASHIMTAWSMCLWKDKYSNYLNYYTKQEFNSRLGKSLFSKICAIKDYSLKGYLSMKKMGRENRITPDFMMAVYMRNNDMLQVFPNKTLISQNGRDGSGMHSVTDDSYKFNIKESDSNFAFAAKFDEKTIKKNYKLIKKSHNSTFYYDLKFILEVFLKLFYKKLR